MEEGQDEEQIAQSVKKKKAFACQIIRIESDVFISFNVTAVKVTSDSPGLQPQGACFSRINVWTCISA